MDGKGFSITNKAIYDMYVQGRLTRMYPPIKCENCEGIMYIGFVEGDTRDTYYSCELCPLAIPTFLYKEIGTLGGKMICPYCRHSWESKNELIRKCEKCGGRLK